MSDRRSLNPVRLEEIQRLTGIAEAEFNSELAAATRKRRVFGPLFYSTVILAAIVTLITGVLRVVELMQTAMHSRREVSPDSVVAASVIQFKDQNWETRAAATKTLGAALLTYGPGDNTAGTRGEALRALRNALADKAGPVRAGAAEALGNARQFGTLVKDELMAALKDEDLTVRLAAAHALLNMKDESSVTALGALSDMVMDPNPSSDRKTVVSLMRSEGRAGTDAAVKSLATILTSTDAALRADALNCIAALDDDAARLAPVLESLLSAKDVEVRYTAVLAAARITSEGQAPGRQLISTLEAAVIDAALAATIREEALNDLTRLSKTSLGRCGRALARQLEDSNYHVRLQAATLLHMIDPEALADREDPVTEP